MSQDYMQSNQRLFQSKETPFATSTTPDVGRFKRMTIAADGENKAPTGARAEPVRRGPTMGSLLQWDA